MENRERSIGGELCSLVPRDVSLLIYCRKRTLPRTSLEQLRVVLPGVAQLVLLINPLFPVKRENL